ncbi:hypothetical protein A4X13_0g2554 [Tilletia indica]|uniref:Peptide N-acetyl-beta-D-glucosaminyl asparaginase amidase A N-terminal domain-containing protein n=1 Tax=Tilletia indica TaxID=43049 RepID=A0A177TM76_9BASI|nr:hypothetical protein A4X13_0g2554 [Tilletia indica]
MSWTLPAVQARSRHNLAHLLPVLLLLIAATHTVLALELPRSVSPHIAKRLALDLKLHLGVGNANGSNDLVLADLDLTTSNVAVEAGAKSAPAGPLRNFEVNVPPRVLPQIQSLTSCSVDLIYRSFNNSYGNPSVFSYSPSLLGPKCADPSKWTSIVLTQQGASRGRQFDRLGSVAIGNPSSNGPVEIWRTDNAEPTLAGVTWLTRKDVSQYFSLFKQSGSTMIFDYPNVVDGTYTGALNITLSMTVYQPKTTATKSRSTRSRQQVHLLAREHRPDQLSNEERGFSLSVSSPAPLSDRSPDLIYALSGTNHSLSTPALSQIGAGVQGSANSASSSLSTTITSFPINAARAIVEVYASGTAQDEFWYSNVPSSLAEQVPGAADLGLYGGGPYREVQVRIDGVLAGIISPYAVIFTGGIQPLLWRPESAFGAYNQPTYLVDITPFIGTLTDSKPHTFDLLVQSADRNGSYPQGWFLSGNLQVVLDSSSARTTGQLISTPSKPSYLPYPTLTTTGKVMGDLSKNGTLTATVRTSKGAPRTISVVGEVKAGSMKAAARYTWTQSFDYRSDLLQNAAVSTSKQTASGSSTLTASAKNASQSFPLYAQSFSFPINTLSAYDGQFLNGSVQHSYETKLASLDALLEPWLGTNNKKGGGAKLGLPLAQKISTSQDASAYSMFNGTGGVVGGAGITSQTYSYADSNLFTFDRQTSVNNRTITQDTVSGTLASEADPVR